MQVAASITTTTHQSSAIPWRPGGPRWPLVYLWSPPGTQYRLEGVGGRMAVGCGTASPTNIRDNLCGVPFSADQRRDAPRVMAPSSSSEQSCRGQHIVDRYVLKEGVVVPNSLTSSASLARQTHLHHAVLILIHLYFFVVHEVAATAR
ncbi:hypothetical protein E2C01_075545 [Portunus trituberculatus]|uniref:Uncharacterized protein n=1 Tax=Portunus trituberculatus TaxID=210409 RepID=A0A5B7IHB8_PORTR|nr:hypothetical protein [Portunus trituberculatus]